MHYITHTRAHTHSCTRHTPMHTNTPSHTFTHTHTHTDTSTYKQTQKETYPTLNTRAHINIHTAQAHTGTHVPTSKHTTNIHTKLHTQTQINHTNTHIRHTSRNTQTMHIQYDKNATWTQHNNVGLFLIQICGFLFVCVCRVLVFEMSECIVFLFVCLFGLTPTMIQNNMKNKQRT